MEGGRADGRDTVFHPHPHKTHPEQRHERKEKWLVTAARWKHNPDLKEQDRQDARHTLRV